MVRYVVNARINYFDSFGIRSGDLWLFKLNYITQRLVLSLERVQALLSIVLEFLQLRL